MKKTTLLLASFLLLCNITFAQNTIQNPYFWKGEKKQLDVYHNFVKQMLAKNPRATASKPTAAQQRLIKYTIGDQAGQLADSIQYIYSGDNGSNFDEDFLYFKDYYNPLFISPVDYPYGVTDIGVSADSTYYFGKDDQPGSVLELNSIFIGNYTTSKKVADYEYYYYSSGAASGKEGLYNTYNSAGDLTAIYLLSDQSGTYDSVAKMLLYYDGQGRHYTDSIYTYNSSGWSLVQVVNQHFDANNNIDTFSRTYNTTNGWVTAIQFVNEFYSDNRLKKTSIYQFDGTALEPVFIDSFEYVTGINTFSVVNETQIDVDSVVTHLKIQKAFNTQGLSDSLYISVLNPTTSNFEIVQFAKYYYNNYNNPDSARYYGNTGSSIVYIGSEKFYYQEYHPTSIKNAREMEDMKVYPNPTTNQLSITWDESDGKKATIEIVNAMGQKLSSQSFAWQTKTQTINMSLYATGMYWVIVKSADGGVLYQQSIIKE